MTTLELQAQPETQSNYFNKVETVARFVLERLTATGESHPSGRDTSKLGLSAYFDRTVTAVPTSTKQEFVIDYPFGD